MNGEPSTNFLEGKFVLISGGSSGIGRAIAESMIARGGQVLITGRRVSLLEETAADLTRQGGKCEWIEADISQEDGVARVMDKARETFGGLDVLVNNAGVFRTGSIHEMSTEDFDLMFNTNVRGVFLMSRAAVGVMSGRPGANIINISSIAGTRFDPGMGLYEASKSAVNTITKVMAKELAPVGIRVNAIAPGPTQTPGLYAGQEDPAEQEVARQRMVSAVPFGRLGEPRDIARLAIFLASPEADFISGSVTSIDGAMGY